jgi:hypothetical protein
MVTSACDSAGQGEGEGEGEDEDEDEDPHEDLPAELVTAMQAASRVCLSSVDGLDALENANDLDAAAARFTDFALQRYQRLANDSVEACITDLAAPVCANGGVLELQVDCFGNDDAVCVTGPAVGEACDFGGCASGVFCDDTVCVALSAVGEPCVGSGPCAAGWHRRKARRAPARPPHCAPRTRTRASEVHHRFPRIVSEMMALSASLDDERAS